MGLMGLQDYLDEHYQLSIFDQAKNSDVLWESRIHGHRILNVRILENLPYDLKAHVEGEGPQLIQKTDIKLIYPASVAKQVRPFDQDGKKGHGLGAAAHPFAFPQTPRQEQVLVSPHEGTERSFSSRCWRGKWSRESSPTSAVMKSR